MRTRHRFPDVRVVIHELESPDAIEALRDGHCHLAVSFAYNLVPRLDSPGFASQQLMEEPVLLALPEPWRAERDPIDLKRLAQEDWIVGSRQTDDRLLAERACAAAGFAPRITHTVDDYDLLLRMVSAGLGVGFVPELALRFPGAEAVAVCTPAGAPLSRRVHALARGTVTASPLARALLSELVSGSEAHVLGQPATWGVSADYRF
jgi:DNA-binding transcriptional LysR family regulator